jgi:dihydroorotase
MSARLWLLLSIGLAPVARAQSYDLVIRNGRVMDPASRLDAVRSIGIRAGRIAAISTAPLTGASTIDAKGLVVAPGFIDLHSHSIGIDGDKWQVRDGVTTALELEEGSFPVAEWYARQEGKSLINFGTSAGHIPARIAVMQGVKTLAEEQAIRMGENGSLEPDWSHKPASPEQIERLIQTVRSGLEAGGLGIGFEVNESPAASRLEILRLFQLAKSMGVPIYAHPRLMGVDPITGSMAGAQEILADAAVTGASTHFVHLGSSGGIYARELVQLIEAARARGLDVTGEAYPYTASSTGINTAMFDTGWQDRLGISYDALEWPPTGERMTETSFPKFRAQGGAVIMHWMKDENVDWLIGKPGVMIASDAMPLPGGKGHPRGVGTFARVLGRYVREKRVLGLMDALRKMTLEPAERVRGAAPAMARKGRISVGADADLTIFDPATVIDRATFANPEQASAGIPYVVVNGTVVVRQGQLVAGAAPGRAVKRGMR